MAAPDVVVTIRPLHALTAQVMDGVGEPDLLLESIASPHSYAMRPSDALAINGADLLVWTGEAMETFLTRLVPGLPRETAVLTAIETPGVSLLPARAANAQGEAEAGTDGEEDGHRHAAGLPDPHIWLDPDNAVVLLTAIAEILGEVDPDNAALYNANADEAASRIERLRDDITDTLAPVSGRRYMAAHDAYQYFEHAFGLGYGGAITAHPGRPPSAKHILEITGRIREADIGCLLTEPGNNPPLIVRLADESGMRLAEADPLGLALTPGPELYDQLMRNLAGKFAGCLGG